MGFWRFLANFVCAQFWCSKPSKPITNVIADPGARRAIVAAFSRCEKEAVGGQRPIVHHLVEFRDSWCRLGDVVAGMVAGGALSKMISATNWGKFDRTFSLEVLITVLLQLPELNAAWWSLMEPDDTQWPLGATRVLRFQGCNPSGFPRWRSSHYSSAHPPTPHNTHAQQSTPIEIVHVVNPAPYRDRRMFCGPWLTNNKGQFSPASNFPSVRLLHTASHTPLYNLRIRNLSATLPLRVG